MERRYKIFGRKWKEDQPQLIETLASFRAAIRAAHKWLRGGYLGESDVWVNGVDVHPNLIYSQTLRHYWLTSSGYVLTLHCEPDMPIKTAA